MTITVNEYGTTIMTPGEGMYLTNGEIYADSPIYLGIHASTDDWYETDSLPDPESDGQENGNENEHSGTRTAV